MFAPNCPEYIDFLLGCAKPGVIGAATNIREVLKKELRSTQRADALTR